MISFNAKKNLYYNNEKKSNDRNVNQLGKKSMLMK